MVIALWIFLSQILCEDIVAGTCQSVAAHATIVLMLISSLPRGTETHNDITRTDVGIVDDILALHAASDSGVNDDGTYQIADICSFTTGCIYAYTHFTEFGQQFICSVDDGRNHFSWYKQLVTADGRRY